MRNCHFYSLKAIEYQQVPLCSSLRANKKTRHLFKCVESLHEGIELCATVCCSFNHCCPSPEYWINENEELELEAISLYTGPTKHSGQTSRRDQFEFPLIGLYIGVLNLWINSPKGDGKEKKRKKLYALGNFQTS
jgi:hypothetical protein